MAKKSIRLSSTIEFDTINEAKVVQGVEYLLKKHSLGVAIENLLRVAFNSPEALESSEKLRKTVAEISKNTQDEETEFDKIKREIASMRKKVDKIYEMNYNLLCLANMGKHLGLEDKVKNSLSAQFILERQLMDLATVLEIEKTMLFSSNRLEKTEERAQSVLEFILNTYDGIVNELAQNLVPKIVVQQGTTVVNEKVEEEDEKEETEKETEKEKDVLASIEEENMREIEVKEDEVDFDAINNFLI